MCFKISDLLYFIYFIENFCHLGRFDNAVDSKLFTAVSPFSI